MYGGTSTGPSGPALVDFDTSTPSIPSTPGDVTFAPEGSLQLQASTTYWIDVSGTSNTLNGIVWYGSNPGIVPTGLATSDGALFSSMSTGISSLAPSSVLNTFLVTRGTSDTPSRGFLSPWA